MLAPEWDVAPLLELPTPTIRHRSARALGGSRHTGLDRTSDSRTRRRCRSWSPLGSPMSFAHSARATLQAGTRFSLINRVVSPVPPKRSARDTEVVPRCSGRTARLTIAASKPVRRRRPNWERDLRSKQAREVAAVLVGVFVMHRLRSPQDDSAVANQIFQEMRRNRLTLQLPQKW